MSEFFRKYGTERESTRNETISTKNFKFYKNLIIFELNRLVNYTPSLYLFLLTLMISNNLNNIYFSILYFQL